MRKTWTPENWKKLPAEQQPEWENLEVYNKVLGNPSAIVLIKKIEASAGSSDVSFVNGTDGVVFDSTYKEYIFYYPN